MSTSYKVALWPSRLAALPVDTLDIDADTPLLAAIQAMKTHGQGQGLVMGVVVAMSAEKQYTFFDAQWRDDALFFSKEEEFSRFSPDPLLENSKKWRA